MKRNFCFALGLLSGLLFLFASSLEAQAAQKPEGIIPALQRAIDSRDMTLAEKNIDTDTVVQRGVNLALSDPDIVQELKKNMASAIFLSLGASSGGEAAIRSLLGAEAKEYIRHGVTSGAFAGKPIEGASVYSGIFSKAFRGEDKDKRSFGPSRVVRQNKDSAELETSMTVGRKKLRYPLRLLAKKQIDGNWKVCEVLNMGDLLGAGKEKAAQ